MIAIAVAQRLFVEYTISYYFDSFNHFCVHCIIELLIVSAKDKTIVLKTVPLTKGLTGGE